MCDTRQAGDDYAEGYPACEADTRGLGRGGVVVKVLFRFKEAGMG